MARLSVRACNAAVQAVGGLADAGTTPGTIEVRTGAQPATPESTADGTLLATFVLNDPAFATAASGSVSIDVSIGVMATGVADGDAGWSRMLDSDGHVVMDATVSAIEGTADLILNTITVTTGLDLFLYSLDLTMPTT